MNKLRECKEKFIQSYTVARLIFHKQQNLQKKSSSNKKTFCDVFFKKWLPNSFQKKKFYKLLRNFQANIVLVLPILVIKNQMESDAKTYLFVIIKRIVTPLLLNEF